MQTLKTKNQMRSTFIIEGVQQYSKSKDNVPKHDE